MKVIFAGGGTGGHVFLGIAIARELLRRDPGCDIRFVGTRRGLESKIVPREGFPIEYIESAGLKGMSIGKFSKNLLLVPKSLVQSWKVLAGTVPDVVVGVGGYASGPLLLAAWGQRRRTLIIEPNAYPGLTNRWLARIVDRAALALPDIGGYFGPKGVVTGIPVRQEFGQIMRHERSAIFTVLIYGGSQGSHALNSTVCGALPQLSKDPRLFLIHQTGEAEYQAVKKAHESAGMNSDVRAFLPAIYDEFGRADLIISRAGAGTVAELTASGKPAILIPFPGAADDHQTKNALALQQHGAAKMIPESDWTPARLCGEIGFFIEHPEELDRMARASRALAKPEATRTITDLVVGLARQGR